MRNKEDTGFKEHINKHLPPLEFQNCTENTYTKCLFDITKCPEYLDELEARYEELDDKKTRIDAVDVIGSDIYFVKDMEDDFYEDDE